MIKEDINVEDDDDEWLSQQGGECSDGESMNEPSHIPPRPYSEASNSSLPNFDPALVSNAY